MKQSEAIGALAALAQDSRLQLFRLLVRRGPDGYTPSQLAEKLAGIAAPTLSFHLKSLQQAGLVEVRRAGRNLHYSANFGRMNALLRYLGEQCCSLAETGRDPASCAPVAVAVPLPAPLARRRRA